MISTNIDGTQGGANQLLDLLSVVSNPKVYEEKVKTLQKAIEDNQKYVELVGPANDILILRDRAVEELEKAKNEVKQAKIKAAETTNIARAKAESIISEAKAEAKAKVDEATAIKSAAIEVQAEAQKAQAEAQKAQAEAQKVQAEAQANAAKAEAALKEAKKAQKAADELRNQVIQKHLDFIKSL